MRPGWIRAERTLNGEDVYGVVKRFITALDIDATFPLEAASAELHYTGKTNRALELARESIAVAWEANQKAAAGDGGKDVKASDDEKEQVRVHVGSGDNVKDNHGDAKRVDESKTGAEVANAAAAEDDDVKDNDGDTKRVGESDDVGAEVADESSKMLNGGGAKVDDESKIHKEPGEDVDDEATGSLAVATGNDD